MIRFCDSDVGVVEYGTLGRSKILSYFLSGHIEEIVCVYNDPEAEEFIGIITYDSLLYAVSVDAAILKEYVILDQDVWRNAREIFKKRGRNNRKTIPLPVLDKDYNLICFAYQDMDANREIRMLRELKEAAGRVLRFSDVFPEYKCVKIFGFNELAYFFADYLKEQNIPVHLDNVMWQAFFSNEECQYPEYECLNIYAEGTWEKSNNWKESLLRSVSVEFECIDKIYEANIKSNYIGNASEGKKALLERLRGEKEVILYGTDIKVQDAYDFLTANGVEVCCFAVNELSVRQMHRLFGKKIIGINEAVYAYRNPVFVDCTTKYSAWGLGDVDYFDYIGYKRNENFVMLRDYTEVSVSNLLNVLRSMKVVLAGDRYLCSKLYEYLTRKEIAVIGYLCTLPEDAKPENIPEVSVDDVGEDIMCLIAEPAYYSYAKSAEIGEEDKERRIAYLEENNIDNYTDYFGEMIPFINIEKEVDAKYTTKRLMPKRIVLGSILGHNGNFFLKALLDSHPNIMWIHYIDLNEQIFWLCVRLSTQHAENVPDLFCELTERNTESIVNQPAFITKLKQLLKGGDRYTSQELFVMFHIAYMQMHGMDVTEENIRNMIIYWEPHYLDLDKLEECVKWLGIKKVPCDIINVVRNVISQKGSSIRLPGCYERGSKEAYRVVLQSMPLERKKYEQSNRLIVKFEDLKCKTKEVLQKLCSEWDLLWSDLLMQVTWKGQEAVYDDGTQQVRGFDLKPVYNTYENFFSEFDRLRILLIQAPWQKKYGYPYAESDLFTRKALQEMFLKEFQFEDPGDTTGLYKDYLDLDNRIAMQESVRRRLQETRCLLNTDLDGNNGIQI